MVSQQTMDFVRALINGGVLDPKAIDDNKFLFTVELITKMSQEKIEQEGNGVKLIWYEFSDWIETYNGAQK